MFDDLTDLYQQVILDHSKSPRNFRRVEGANRTAQGHNPLCGDNISLFLRMEGDRVEDIGFQGSGCAISRASASLLTESMKGRTKAEVKQMFEHVHELVTKGKSETADVGKFEVFAGVHKFPARVKCAMLAWHAALAALDGEEKTVSTEDAAS